MRRYNGFLSDIKFLFSVGWDVKEINIILHCVAYM